MEEKEDGMDLVFETIRKKNQGDYACKAIVRGQEMEKKFTLSVFSEFYSIHTKFRISYKRDIAYNVYKANIEFTRVTDFIIII